MNEAFVHVKNNANEPEFQCHKSPYFHLQSWNRITQTCKNFSPRTDSWHQIDKLSYVNHQIELMGHQIHRSMIFWYNRIFGDKKFSTNLWFIWIKYFSMYTLWSHSDEAENFEFYSTTVPSSNMNIMRRIINNTKSHTLA